MGYCGLAKRAASKPCRTLLFGKERVGIAMGRKTKKTVVYRGFFGEKHIKSKWVDEPSGCLTAVVALILLWGLTSYFRGCR
jgi:hypothetical protein